MTSTTANSTPTKAAQRRADGRARRRRRPIKPKPYRFQVEEAWTLCGIYKVQTRAAGGSTRQMMTAVFHRLLSKAQNDNGRVWESMAAIAEELDVKEDTVSRAIKALISLGAIEDTGDTVPAAGGGTPITVWRVLPVTPEQVSAWFEAEHVARLSERSGAAPPRMEGGTDGGTPTHGAGDRSGGSEGSTPTYARGDRHPHVCTGDEQPRTTTSSVLAPAGPGDGGEEQGEDGREHGQDIDYVSAPSPLPLTVPPLPLDDVDSAVAWFLKYQEAVTESQLVQFRSTFRLPSWKDDKAMVSAFKRVQSRLKGGSA